VVDTQIINIGNEDSKLQFRQSKLGIRTMYLEIVVADTVITMFGVYNTIGVVK